MEYQEAVDYLFAQLPMFQRLGAAAYKVDLGNIVALTAALDYPEKAYPTVHIAGTNGKGSVSSMLSSILMEAGYKTGLFTSPHLRSFTERIRVNGQEISQNAVVSFVEKYKNLLDEVQPSFFEATALMAFEYFRQERVDIAVIEVGMGGRLDSTNIIFPETTAITNISKDHAQFLGDTLAKIAAEKAGIMKANTDAIIGQTTDETLEVFQRIAGEKSANLLLAQKKYQAKRLSGDLKHQRFLISDIENNQQFELDCDLSGYYQRWNIPVVLCLVDSLREKGWQLPQAAVLNGIAHASKNAGFKGRMTLLQENPIVIADIAHNEAGVDEVLAQIKSLKYEQLHIVWGMVNDKDIGHILRMLPHEAHYYFVCPNIPRGLDIESLAIAAKHAGLQGSTWPSVSLGYAAALRNASQDDLIYVGGSTFVVAEVV